MLIEMHEMLDIGKGNFMYHILIKTKYINIDIPLARVLL